LLDEIGLFDAVLMFYQGLIAFDHVQHRLWIVRNVFGRKRIAATEIRAAVREIERTRKLLNGRWLPKNANGIWRKGNRSA
jgi:hypothetical protein